MYSFLSIPYGQFIDYELIYDKNELFVEIIDYYSTIAYHSFTVDKCKVIWVDNAEINYYYDDFMKDEINMFVRKSNLKIFI